MAEYNYNFQEKTYSNSTTPEDIEDNWIWAIIGYMGPFSFLSLFINKSSLFSSYHARQGVGLFVLEIIWLILWTISNFFIPTGIKYLFLIGTTFFVAGQLWLFSLFIIGVINSYKGQMKALPVIGKHFEIEQ